MAGLEDAKSWAGVARACAPLVLSGSAGIDVIDVICTEIRVALSSNFDRDRLHHLRLGSVALLLHGNL